MPTLDDDFETGARTSAARGVLQLGVRRLRALHDRRRLSEVTSTTVDSDRDLLIVVKSHYLPLTATGWDFDAMAKIDFYFGDGQHQEPQRSTSRRRGSAPALGDAGMTATRSSSPTGRHLVSRDAIATSSWCRSAQRHHATIISIVLGVEVVDHAVDQGHAAPRLHLNGFIDDDDSGGSFEAGMDVDGPGSSTTAARTSRCFGNVGQFQKTAGGRAFRWSVILEDGRWDFFYEFAYVNIDKQPAISNEMLNHRIRASRQLLHRHRLGHLGARRGRPSGTTRCRGYAGCPGAEGHSDGGEP